LEFLSAAKTALGDEIIDAAPALFVTRIPVLDGRVFNLGALERDEFDNRRVELVFIAHRRCASFEIADVRSFLGDDERSLELAGIGRIDSEVSGQFHRTSNAFRDVTKGTSVKTAEFSAA